MHIPSAAIYWTGVVVACGIYLFIICRIIDAIWDKGVTKMVFALLCGLVLRPIIRWTAGLYALLGCGSILVSAFFMYEDPWKSVLWVVGAIPVIRLLIWVFWLLSPEGHMLSWTRTSEAKYRGMGTMEIFLRWCFYWGPFNGLDPEVRLRREKKLAAQRDAIAAAIGSN